LKNKKVTLVYGAKDEEHNNAVVLKDFLKKWTYDPLSFSQCKNSFCRY
jgi:hypothetical protein